MIRPRVYASPFQFAQPRVAAAGGHTTPYTRGVSLIPNGVAVLSGVGYCKGVTSVFQCAATSDGCRSVRRSESEPAEATPRSEMQRLGGSVLHPTPRSGFQR